MSCDLREEKVQYVKTVGPGRSRLLAKLGIHTVWDLLYHFPRRHEDRTALKPVFACPHGTDATVLGTVLGYEEIKPRRGLTVSRIALSDGSTVFYAVWFNQPYIAKQLSPGTKLLVSGRINHSFKAIQVQVTDFEKIDGGGETLHTGRIVPIYPLTQNLSQRSMRTIVKSALETKAGALEEFLPPGVIAAYRLPLLPEAICQMHFPVQMAALKDAERRFIFEELFLLQIFVQQKRAQIVRRTKNYRLSFDGELIRRFLTGLPFCLTGAQRRAWREIAADMEGPAPMYRLLQGEVGSGKTVIAMLALLKAVENGLQGALLAPTEILAEQHYLSLKKALEPLGVKVGFCSGSVRGFKKAGFLSGLKSGEIQIAIGTHALLQEGVFFHRLGVAVIDEQHRFGVRQRSIMQEKGNQPDVLVMTATPIPRTLALTLYGDLCLTTIDELPPHRQMVKTYRAGYRHLDRVYARVREEVMSGRQAYVVCPLIEESENMDIQAAVDLAEKLKQGPLSGLSVGLLHGKLKPEEKEAVMSLFREGRIAVMVCTTVVEVGVDVPNATVMVILDAERFGLAQLHQLRGRVGRGIHPSICLLVSGSRSREACARLKALEEIADGFKLAEVDMQIRGPGEVWGTRQSGLPALRVADLVRDHQILELCAREAELALTRDPKLELAENERLRKEIEARFARSGSYISIG